MKIGEIEVMDAGMFLKMFSGMFSGARGFNHRASV